MKTCHMHFHCVQNQRNHMINIFAGSSSLRGIDIICIALVVLICLMQPCTIYSVVRVCQKPIKHFLSIIHFDHKVGFKCQGVQRRNVKKTELSAEDTLLLKLWVSSHVRWVLGLLYILIYSHSNLKLDKIHLALAAHTCKTSVHSLYYTGSHKNTCKNCESVKTTLTSFEWTSINKPG